MDFNLGKSQTKDMMPYVRTAIERYFYERLGENLNAIYAYKNQSADEVFASRWQQLQDTYEARGGVKEIMDFLGIKGKLQL